MRRRTEAQLVDLFRRLGQDGPSALEDISLAVVEDDHLVFMEENQAVVHWGIPLNQKRRADPEVWQRVNEDGARWYSEEMAFATFILKNLAWQHGVELVPASG